MFLSEGTVLSRHSRDISGCNCTTAVHEYLGNNTVQRSDPNASDRLRFLVVDENAEKRLASTSLS